MNRVAVVSARSLLCVTALAGAATAAEVSTDAGTSTAPAELQEIVVTAEKRAVSAKDLPISIYAVGGPALEQFGVTAVENLTQLAPSLQFAKSFNTSYMTIRGIGSETSDLGADPAIALSQDGIPLVRPQMLNADLLDVDRVEVLRGPQGTIAGRNATAGAVNIHSNMPTDTVSGRVSVTAGGYSLIRTESFLSGPLVGDWLLGRVAIGTENADGWIRNSYVDPAIGGTGRRADLNDSNRSHGRVVLLVDPGAAFKGVITVDRLVDKSVPQAGMILTNARGDGSPDELDFNNSKNGTEIPHPNPRTLFSQSDLYQSSHVTQTITGLKLSYDFAPNTSVTSNTGYVRRRSQQYVDYDGTAAILTENTPVEFNSNVFSQELTFLARPFQALDIIFGGMYVRDASEEPLVFRSDNVGATAPGLDIQGLEQITQSKAVYAQLRYFATDSLHFDLGARYTRDDKEIRFGPETFNGFQIAELLTDSASWNAFTPRLAVHYDATPLLALFASVSRGYKAGGYNALSAPQKYNPEFVTTGEIGAKYQSGRISAGLTGFYSDYKDIQENIYLPNAAGVPSAEVRNVSKARIFGVEMEADARVTDFIRLFGNATFMHGRIKNGAGVDPTFPERGVQDFDGRRLTRAPTFQGVFGTEVRQPVSDQWVWYLNGSYRWQSQMYFDIYNDATTSQGGYGLANLRTGIENRTGSWQASVFVDNAFDKRYFSNKINLGILTTSTYGLVGTPRLWGVTISHRF
jgi:iron complex outermembrane receptor protein